MPLSSLSQLTLPLYISKKLAPTDKPSFLYFVVNNLNTSRAEMNHDKYFLCESKDIILIGFKNDIFIQVNHDLPLLIRLKQ